MAICDTENPGATILIDGRRRSRLNSKGRPIHPSELGIVNFWRWFGDSCAVDAAGRPLVLYHGTPNGGFACFENAMKGCRTQHAPDDVGFHFTDSLSYAETYSEGYKLESIENYRSMFGHEPAAIRMPEGASIYPVYLRVKNPITIPYSKQVNAALIRETLLSSHDGIVADMGGAMEYVVFHAEQIKSAVGNSGAFTPDNPHLTEFDAHSVAYCLYRESSCPGV